MDEEGARIESVTTPKGLARRVTTDFYEALLAEDLPALDSGDRQAIVLKSAIEGRTEDPESSLELANAYLDIRPHDPKAIRLRAVLHAVLGEYEAMTEDAQELVELGDAAATCGSGSPT